MPLTFSVAMNEQAAVDLQAQWNDALGAIPEIHFFDGAMPLTCEDADAGTKLAEVSMSATPFDDVTGNEFSANAINPGGVLVGGTVQYFRMKTAGGTVVTQGDAGEGGTEAIVFNEATWVADQVITITSFDVLVVLVGI